MVILINFIQVRLTIIITLLFFFCKKCRWQFAMTVPCQSIRLDKKTDPSLTTQKKRKNHHTIVQKTYWRTGNKTRINGQALRTSPRATPQNGIKSHFYKIRQITRLKFWFIHRLSIETYLIKFQIAFMLCLISCLSICFMLKYLLYFINLHNNKCRVLHINLTLPQHILFK